MKRNDTLREAVFIAVPHQMPAHRWYDEPGGEACEHCGRLAELNEDGSCGCHDLHGMRVCMTVDDLWDLAKSKTGHQWPRVATLAQKALDEFQQGGKYDEYA
jgi:hypothetical protein